MTEKPILFSGEMVRAILDGRKTQTRRVVSPHTSEIGSLPIGEWHSLDFATPDQRLRTDRLGGGMYLHVPRRDGETVHRVYSRIEPGDRLWVRETFARVVPLRSGRTEYGGARVVSDPEGTPTELWYRADGEIGIVSRIDPEGPRWTPSIHMPRWACRLVLDVTDVRVERLQDITEEDARAEGMRHRDTGRNRWGAPSPGWSWEDPHPADTMLDAPWEHCLRTPRYAFGNLWNAIYAKRGHGWQANPWVWVVTFERVPAETEQRPAPRPGGAS